MNMIEVKTSELIGPALDWSVLMAIQKTPFTDETARAFFSAAKAFDFSMITKFSTDWAYGGPLIDKYGVLLSPPKSMMHVNGGPNAGWRETGTWGSTIFGSDRKHRRKAFDHPDQPLVPAMRAIVQFELGDVVSVPAELIGPPK